MVTTNIISPDHLIHPHKVGPASRRLYSEKLEHFLGVDTLQDKLCISTCVFNPVIATNVNIKFNQLPHNPPSLFSAHYNFIIISI